ncbi:MAG: hypothetical protein ACK5O7_01585 [Holosporales bacterium]
MHQLIYLLTFVMIVLHPQISCYASERIRDALDEPPMTSRPPNVHDLDVDVEEDYRQTLRACLALSECQVSHHEQLLKIALENSVEAEEHIRATMELFSFTPIIGIPATVRYLRSSLSCENQQNALYWRVTHGCLAELSQLSPTDPRTQGILNGLRNVFHCLKTLSFDDLQAYASLVVSQNQHDAFKVSEWLHIQQKLTDMERAPGDLEREDRQQSQDIQEMVFKAPGPRSTITHLLTEYMAYRDMERMICAQLIPPQNAAQELQFSMAEYMARRIRYTFTSKLEKFSENQKRGEQGKNKKRTFYLGPKKLKRIEDTLRLEISPEAPKPKTAQAHDGQKPRKKSKNARKKERRRQVLALEAQEKEKETTQSPTSPDSQGLEKEEPTPLLAVQEVSPISIFSSPEEEEEEPAFDLCAYLDHWKKLKATKDQSVPRASREEIPDPHKIILTGEAAKVFEATYMYKAHLVKKTRFYELCWAVRGYIFKRSW